LLDGFAIAYFSPSAARSSHDALRQQMITVLSKIDQHNVSDITQAIDSISDILVLEFVLVVVFI